MTVDWAESNGAEWREEYLDLKGAVPVEDLQLLEKGAKTMKQAWRLGALHSEYKRLKKGGG